MIQSEEVREVFPPMVTLNLGLDTSVNFLSVENDGRARQSCVRKRGIRAANFFSGSTIIYSQLGICKLREAVDPEARKGKSANIA